MRMRFGIAVAAVLLVAAVAAPAAGAAPLITATTTAPSYANGSFETKFKVSVDCDSSPYASGNPGSCYGATVTLTRKAGSECPTTLPSRVGIQSFEFFYFYPEREWIDVAKRSDFASGSVAYCAYYWDVNVSPDFSTAPPQLVPIASGGTYEGPAFIPPAPAYAGSSYKSKLRVALGHGADISYSAPPNCFMGVISLKVAGAGLRTASASGPKDCAATATDYSDLGSIGGSVEQTNGLSIEGGGSGFDVGLNGRAQKTISRVIRWTLMHDKTVLASKRARLTRRYIPAVPARRSHRIYKDTNFDSFYNYCLSSANDWNTYSLRGRIYCWSPSRARKPAKWVNSSSSVK